MYVMRRLCGVFYSLFMLASKPPAVRYCMCPHTYARSDKIFPSACIMRTIFGSADLNPKPDTLLGLSLGTVELLLHCDRTYSSVVS